MECLKKFLERAPRHPVDMEAWIRRQGSFATQPCRVLDVSRSGVRIDVANAYGIPDKFLLLFSKSDTGHNATVKWRRDTQMGVKFGAGE